MENDQYVDTKLLIVLTTLYNSTLRRVRIGDQYD